MLLSDHSNCDSNIKVALASLTNIVRKTNRTIIDLAQNNSLGYDMSIKLCNRTNEYFIKFLK